MPRKERIEIIKQIEEYRKSKLIIYFLGDRPNLNTVIADDSVRFFYEHLKKIGKVETIELFLYTRGGVGVTPARLVSLIREYCKVFNILVPYRCHSGGTVMCCGANNILMTKLAEISPVDPSTGNAFNPQLPTGPIPISVEDVRAYLSLANASGIKSEGAIIEAFKLLASQIHVLALGNVQRVYNTNVKEIPNLLKFHVDENKYRGRIEQITKALSETYTHDYFITRKEGKEIGLPIVEADEKLEELMMNLFSVYEKDLLLLSPFIPDLLLDQESLQFIHETAYIESLTRTDAFIQEGNITRSPPQLQPQMMPAGMIPNMPLNLPPVPDLPVVRFTKQEWIDITEQLHNNS